MMKKKILIVDDEPEQIAYASTLLEQNGYAAISASNGAEGMNLVRTQMPDLILLDIMMPEKGGISMYQELKKDKTTRDIPVVIVTGVTRGASRCSGSRKPLALLRFSSVGRVRVRQVRK